MPGAGISALPKRWRRPTPADQAIFEAAFREHGLPEAIRTDNGAPFASSAICGLSRLAVWWIKLGIVARADRAGHPEQNGRQRADASHAEAGRGRRPQTGGAQQRELDRFCHEFNHVRPHEALGMETPASVYQPSPRPYPPRQLPEPEYPDAMRALTVNHGHFRWKKKETFSPKCCGERELVSHRGRRRPLHRSSRNLPLAQSTAKPCKWSRCPTAATPNHDAPRAGASLPRPESKNQNLPDKGKVSGMCPV